MSFVAKKFDASYLRVTLKVVVLEVGRSELADDEVTKHSRYPTERCATSGGP
jgi:hypothetical protein